MTTTLAAPSFDMTRFMTLHELSTEMAVTDEDLWLSVANGGSLHTEPWMMLGGDPKPVRGKFAWENSDTYDDVFFLRNDLPLHLERLAAQAVAEAERAAADAELGKYTTRLVYSGAIEPDDRDTRDGSFPVFAATGEPAFAQFRGPWHVEEWAKHGSPNARGVRQPARYVDQADRRDAQAARRAQYEDFLREQVPA